MCLKCEKNTKNGTFIPKSFIVYSFYNMYDECTS